MNRDEGKKRNPFLAVLKYVQIVLLGDARVLLVNLSASRMIA